MKANWLRSSVSCIPASWRVVHPSFNGVSCISASCRVVHPSFMPCRASQLHGVQTISVVQRCSKWIQRSALPLLQRLLQRLLQHLAGNELNSLSCIILLLILLYYKFRSCMIKMPVFIMSNKCIFGCHLSFTYSAPYETTAVCWVICTPSPFTIIWIVQCDG